MTVGPLDSELLLSSHPDDVAKLAEAAGKTLVICSAIAVLSSR